MIICSEVAFLFSDKFLSINLRITFKENA